MKIGVLSDTRRATLAEKALQNMVDVDIILHAGDLVSDARYLETLNYKIIVWREIVIIMQWSQMKNPGIEERKYFLHMGI